jgi:hypothetical protein
VPDDDDDDDDDDDATKTKTVCCLECCDLSDIENWCRFLKFSRLNWNNACCV